MSNKTKLIFKVISILFQNPGVMIFNIFLFQNCDGDISCDNHVKFEQKWIYLQSFVCFIFRCDKV